MRHPISLILAILMVFLIPVSTAVVSHEAAQVNIPGGTLADLFTGGATICTSATSGDGNCADSQGKWQGTTDIYYNGGNVGIGTSSPSTTLDIRGSSILQANNQDVNLIIDSLSDNHNAALVLREQASNYGYKLYYDSNTFLIDRFNGGGAVNTFAIRRDNGNVGIGTTSPSSKLEVAGAIETNNLLKTNSANFFGSCAAGSSIRVINSDGTVTCETDDVGGGGIGGSGTTNYLPKWTGSSTLGNSIFLDSGGTGVVYGNLVIGSGGSVAADGSITSGGGVVAQGGAPALKVGGINHVYIELYTHGVSGSRSGYIGYPGSGSNQLTIKNEKSGSSNGIRLEGGSGSQGTNAIELAGGTAATITIDPAGSGAYGLFTAGGFQVVGGPKEFDMAHPDKELADKGYRLKHASIESPEVRLYYEGKGIIKNGKATIILPDYFDDLIVRNTEIIHLTKLSKGDVWVEKEDYSNNRIIVHGKDGTEFSWLVSGVRTGFADYTPEYKK